MKFLQPIVKAPVDRAIFVYDIESKAGETQQAGFTRPFLIGFYDGQSYKAFRNQPGLSLSIVSKEGHGAIYLCVDRFMRFLLGMDSTNEEARTRFQSKHGYVYAHNGGKFDHLFMLGWLIAHRETFQFEITSIQAKIQRLDVWLRGTNKKEGCWSFLDSVSLLPMTLDRIGKTFCGELKKLKSFDLHTHEDDPRWETYNKRDCEVLYEGLTAFTNLIVNRLGGEVGITTPATSMKLWRKAFQKEWIEINAHLPDCNGVCHREKVGCDRLSCDRLCHGCAHSFIRRGYYGGRTELFRPYGWNLLYFDLNSSYPTSMLEDMPVGKMTVLDGSHSDLRELASWAKKHVGFVECTVEIPADCDIPPLPHRDVETGKLAFPTGRFTGVWDWDELQLLNHPLVNGKIVSIKKSVWYRKKPIFKPFVQALYAYRRKHSSLCKSEKCKSCNPNFDIGLSETAKLILNAFYGKFGMRPYRTGLLLINEGDKWPKYGWPLGDGDPESSLIWEVETTANAPYIIPQISAHITALSRIRLFLGMMSVKQRGGTVYYCDTDSILADINVTPEGGDLGQWKNEEPGVLLEGEFVLPKLYRLRAHRLGCIDHDCPGCEKKYHHPSCSSDTCKGCATSKQRMKGVGGRQQSSANFDKMLQGETVRWDRVVQHRSMFRAGMLSPMTVEASKSIRSTYDKRVIRSDGTTVPLYIWEKEKA